MKYAQMIKSPAKTKKSVGFKIVKKVVAGVEVMVKVYTPEKSVFEQVVR